MRLSPTSPVSGHGARVGRRTLLGGVAGCALTGMASTGLLSGCRSASSETPPTVVAATAITKVEVNACLASLSTALDQGRKADFLNALSGSDLKRFTPWFDSVRAIPMSMRTFAVESISPATQQWPLSVATVHANVGFAHLVTGVDQAPCMSLFTGTFVRGRPGGPVRVGRLDFTEDATDPWELAPQTVFTSQRAVLTGRAGDRQVGDWRSVLERAAAAAFTFVGATSVTRVLGTVGWNTRDKWWNEQNIYTITDKANVDVLGITTRVDVSSIDDLANSGSAGGAEFAGSRILLNPDMDVSQVGITFCHEALHAIAWSWGADERDLWVVEGFAEWGALRALDLTADDRLLQAVVEASPRLVEARFAQFDQVDPDVDIGICYAAAASVYRFIEKQRGRATAIAFAKAAYAGTTSPYPDRDALIAAWGGWVQTDAG